MKQVRLLLDTHILLWALFEPEKIDKHVYDDIYDYNNYVYVSVETLREIVILQHLGKLDYKMDMNSLFVDLEERSIRILDIKREHILTLEKLSHPVINGKSHEDPFDRMLIAQAIYEWLTLVSSDKKFPYYKDPHFELLQN
jgi:PIN domain nuclease of toxin-antitoxin system